MNDLVQQRPSEVLPRTAIYWTLGKPQRVCTMSDGQLKHKLSNLEWDSESDKTRSGIASDYPPIYYTILQEIADRKAGTVQRESK